MVRRRLAMVIALAAALHAVGIVRTPLPAQDGLKFIRIAKDFGLQPWDAVIRSSDQHPLYPALVAGMRPIISAFAGADAESWRVAAQAVSALASLLILLPIFGLGRELFGRRAGLLAALLWALLPLPATVGRDTLSDPLALLFAAIGLRLGLLALRRPSKTAAIGCGLAGGIGYLARPEVALVPVAVLVTAGLRACCGRSDPGHEPLKMAGARYAALGVALLGTIGSYAMVKGELSEKLALRQAASMPSAHDRPCRAGHWLPPGLDDPRLGFAPKEESNAPGGLLPVDSIARVALAWVEGLGWVLVPFVLIGLFRAGPAREPGRTLLGLFALGFAAVLSRHGTLLGYVSGRHALLLVLASLPWAAAGVLAAAGRVADRFGLSRHGRLFGGWAAIGLIVLAGAGSAFREGHPSRWGHRAAGAWLAEHARPGDAVLDTRGWAAFLSGLRSYDPWHVGQALTDSRLAFVVIGRDELEAPSRRGASYRTLLAASDQPVAAFPGRRNGPVADVLVYRFRRPPSREGLAP